MGLINKEIAWKLGLSPDTIKNFISSALSKSGMGTAGTISSLIKKGYLSADRLSQEFDFSKIKDLNGREKEILEFLSSPQHLDLTCSRIAYELGMPEQSFKNQCGEMYRKLGIIPSFLSLRVFSFLNKNVTS